MSILNTLRGTVQSDPMRVPKAAAMSTGRGDAFATALEEAAPRAEPVAPSSPTPADVDDEIAESTSPVAPDDGKGHAREAGIEDANATDAFVDAPGQPERAVTVVQDSTTRRGEGGKQATAGKGPDSPGGTSTATIGQPLLNELLERGARNPWFVATQPVAAGSNGQPGAAANAGRSVGEPLLRGVEGTTQRGNLPPRAMATTAGYRTSAAASAQMLDQARESVFKQILLKLTPDGGEMRMRLDPPELGELDLRMVVEGGNRMSLAISAQRDDLAVMLQRHIDELTTSLADVGIELTRADVQSREAGSNRDPEPEFGRSGHTKDEHETGRPRTRGYIRADGLDFWV